MPRLGCSKGTTFPLLGALFVVLSAFGRLSAAPEEVPECIPDRRDALIALEELGGDDGGHGDAVVVLDGLRRLWDEHRDNAAIAYLLALGELEGGDVSRAMEPARAAYAEAADCFPVILLFADVSERVGEDVQAASLLGWALEQKPEDVDVRAHLGELLIASGQLERAVEQFERLCELRPRNAAYHLRLARLYAWTQASSKAVEAFARVEELEPDLLEKEDRSIYGDALRMSGRPEAAASQYRRVLAEEPRDTRALAGLALSLSAMGDDEAALGAVDEAIALSPRDAALQAVRARVYHAADRMPESLKAYRRALELAPDDDALRIEAAQVVASDESLRPAALELLAPLLNRSDPDPEHVKVAAEIMSWMPSRRLEAVALCENLLKSHPDDDEAWALLRQSFLWLPPHQIDPAALRRLVEHDPDDPKAAVLLARVLSIQEAAVGESEQAWRHALRLAPMDPFVRLAYLEHRIAHDAVDAKEIDAELLEIEKAVGGDASVLGRIGWLELKYGSPTRAQRFFVELLQQRPCDVGALKGMVEGLNRLGREGAALAFLDSKKESCRRPAEVRVLKSLRASEHARAERLRALDLLEKGDTSEGIRILAALVAKNPSDIESRVALGTVHARLGDLAAARKDFEAALKVDATHLGALRGAAAVARAQGRYGDALELTEREVDSHPTEDAYRRLNRARVAVEIEAADRLLERGRQEDALDLLGRLFEAHPRNPEVATAFAEVLARVGRLNAAGEVAQSAAERAPTEIPIVMRAARILRRAGRHDEARDYVEHARRHADPIQRRELGRLLLSWRIADAEEAKARNDLHRALELYKEAYDAAPDNPDVLKGIGGVYWAGNQPDLAARFYVRALRVDPGDEDALTAAVGTLQASGRLDYLRTLEREGLFADGRHPAVRRLLERARELDALARAWRRGDRSLAELIAERLGRSSPGLADPWVLLGTLQLRAGKESAALRSYRRAAAADPSDFGALSGLIWTYLETGRLEDAEARLTDARRRFEGAAHARALDHLEALLWAARADQARRQGKLRFALELLSHAQYVAPTEAWVYQRIGDLYQTNGRYEDALGLYELALKYAPDDPWALQGRAFALIALRRLREAEAVVKRLEDLAAEGALDERGFSALDPRQARAELEKADGHRERAVELYEALVADRPGNVDLSRGLAGAYLDAGRPLDALMLLNRLLTSNPTDPTLLTSAASALQALRRSDLAVPIMRKVVRYRPSEKARKQLDDAYAAAYMEAAERAKARGQLERAAALYEEAADRGMASVALYRGAAGVQAELGHPREAARLYAKALEGDPDDAVSIIGYAGARAAAGHGRSAARILERAWRRTRDPRVGEAWVSLLIDQGRDLEARRAHEDVMAEWRGRSGDTARSEPSERAEEADVRGVSSGSALGLTADPEHSIADFESLWASIAPLSPGKPVPEIVLPPPEKLLRMEPEQGTVPASLQGGPLPDIAPELALPPRERSGEAGEAWVQGALAEQGGKWTETSRLEASSGRFMEREEDERQKAIGGDRDASSSVVDDDRYEPFRPEPVSRKEDSPSSAPREWEAAIALPALERRVELQTAPRLRVGGDLGFRTGEAGINQLFSLFGDLRLTLFPAHAFKLEPYARPGIISNGEESREGLALGVMVAGGAGPVSLSGGVGTSPLGFRPDASYLLGRLKADVFLADQLTLYGEGAREPVEESLYAWAEALARRDRLGLGVVMGLDGWTSMDLGVDMATYRGMDISDNRWMQGRLDILHRFVGPRPQPYRFRINLNLTAFGFEHQLDAFPDDGLELEDGRGYGGYFSPEFFVTAKVIPAIVSQSSEARFRYRAGLGLGGQYTACIRSLYCSPGARLVLSLDFAGTYRLSRGLFMGASYVFDNVGPEYSRHKLWLYIEKRFGIEDE